jgi:ABC-2 type transport system ATP-binding protein
VSAAIRVDGLGKRYGSTWALRDCSLEIATGSVTALVGPNGAGKTTLLKLAVGLTRPSAGTVEVLGCVPREDERELMPRLGFVAQDHPLHMGFSVGETLTLGRKLNPGWNEDIARERIEKLRIPLGRKIGKLSGGQQAQVALTLALAKEPEVLLLDEPVAALDPLARREFLNSLMEAVTEREMTVVLSSHIVADLERVCDHLVILSESRPLLVGEIDDVVGSHRLLTGPVADPADVARVHDVIRATHTKRQTSLIVRANGHVYDAKWELHDVDLEEIVLAYLGYGTTEHILEEAQ